MLQTNLHVRKKMSIVFETQTISNVIARENEAHMQKTIDIVHNIQTLNLHIKNKETSNNQTRNK